MDLTSTPSRVWYLLTSDQRRSAVILMGLTFFGAVLETLGVGIVLPVFVLITQPDLEGQYPAFSPLLRALGHPTPDQLLIGGMITLAGAYGVKTIYLSFLYWKQSRFIFDFQASLSDRMFLGYLRQPWIFHLQRNSSELIRNAFSEVHMFTYTVLVPGLGLITEIVTVGCVVALLLAVEPVGVLIVVGVFGVIGGGGHLIVRAPMLRWGQARVWHEALKIKYLQEGLGGAKDVKLLGREDDFLSKFRLHNGSSARYNRLHHTLQSLPRLWLELLAVSGLATVSLVMIAQGEPMDTFVPVFGLFGAAAFRLMPSVNRIIGAAQSLRFSLPVLNIMHDEIRLLGDADPPARVLPMAFHRALTLDRIVFRYPSGATPALRSVSLSIPEGACVGFVGTTGAGKSTLVDVILGLLPPASGKVLVDGVDIQTNLRGWQDQIGYVPQSIYLTDDTLRRNIAFGLSGDEIDEAAVLSSISAAQLGAFVDKLPRGLDTVVGERGILISGGERQRIGIARALYHDPAVVVLDEATSSLDVVTERAFMDAVRDLSGTKTVLIIAHRLSTVESCDQIFRLDGGRLIETGVPKELLAHLTDKP
jgi:ABC-type multidrug transport system fused ATPase/permease subunit